MITLSQNVVREFRETSGRVVALLRNSKSYSMYKKQYSAPIELLIRDINELRNEGAERRHIDLLEKKLKAVNVAIANDSLTRDHANPYIDEIEGLIALVLKELGNP